MANSREGAQRAAHNRYHAKPGILKADCAFCILASQAAGNPIMPATPDRPKSLKQAEAQLQITSRLSEDDNLKIKGLASRNRTLAEAATIFGMAVEDFKKEFELGFKGITWEQFAERAAVVQLDEVEAAIYRAAKDGDFRFVQLLIITGRLPNWVPGDPIPMRRLASGAYEIQPSDHLSNVPTSELEARRQKLTAVIDRSTTLQKLASIQSATLEVQDVTEPPPGWVKMPNGDLVTVGCEESYELRQQEIGI
jgi:hypothetical protein